MAQLPANRTKLQAAITNQQPSIIASAQANREAMVEVYDTVDFLNQKVDGLVAGQTLVPFPPDFMSRQAIINGNFDVWQRGTVFNNPATLSYTADRFVHTNNADGGTFPSVTHSRLTLNAGELPGAFNAYRLTVNGAGTGYGANATYVVNQRIEFGTRYLCGTGKKITVSFWARSDIAGKRIGVAMVQRYGTGGTPSANEQLVGTTYNLTSTWTKYTFTFTTTTLSGKSFGTNNDDYLQLQIAHLWGSAIPTSWFGSGTAETFVGAGNIDIAQIQENSGDVALPFQPQDVQDEKRKSLRYTFIPQGTSSQIRMNTFNANVIVFEFPLPVQMRSTPTIRGIAGTDYTVYNMSSVAQTGLTASVALTSNGVKITMTKAAHGLTEAYLDISVNSGFDIEL